MRLDKYERMLKRFELYYPEYYKDMIGWWASGRISIGVKLSNGELIDYNDMENTIRWMHVGEEVNSEAVRAQFGCNLRKIINYCGMTKHDIADKLGITDAMLSRYIHGKTMPSADKAYQLTRILGCTLEELFDDNYIED